jgi:molybdopterin/thiamine biosynthesis adenylyltransferase
MAHVFQVGAGSGGIVILDLLARDPLVTRVTLVEPDVYKPHNVHRHLFPASAVGRPKADLAAEWLRERRPELAVEVLPVDLTAEGHQPAIERAAASCDVGVCAADNEPAKYHFDQLMRRSRKPWTMGEVLSGGIAGWVHRFAPDGPCYGCVASYLQRSAPGDPVAPAPDYADPNGQVRETTIPAGKASIDAVASLHALVTLDLLQSPERQRRGEAELESPERQRRGEAEPVADAPGSEKSRAGNFTSLLFTLARVPGVFDEPYRAYKFRVPRSLTCLICSAVPAPAGEDLDAALDQALSRLGHV